VREGDDVTDSLQDVRLPAEFRHRLDFYWQSTAVYAMTLIAYIIVRALWESSLQGGQISIVLTDPVVVLLGSFVVGSTVVLLFNSAMKRSIIVTDEGITFTSRFHERTFLRSDIERISLGRDPRIRVRGVFSVVKIRIVGRRRTLRIRPALYTNEHELVASILTLRPKKGQP
jgi:hypothetical protein